MALFKYRAVDRQGVVADGTMDESTAERVTAILDERGYQVSEVSRVGKRPGLFSLKPHLTLEDLELFNDHLLAITKSGLPLAPALAGLGRDIKKRRLRTVVTEIQQDLEQGASLEAAIEKHQDSFPPIYSTAVRAGERAGNLSGILAVLNAHSTRMIEIRNTIQSVAAYPLIVLATGLAIILFLVIKVVPVFAQIFEEFGSGLPAPTQFWVDFSQLIGDPLQRDPLSVLFFTVAVVLGVPLAIKFARRTDSGNFALDWGKRWIPVVGRTFVVGSMARFSRSLGILLSGGVPIAESLDLAAAASGNGVLRRRVREATVNVAGGERVADALADTGYFSHTFCWLFSTGEQRGEVDQALLNIAHSYEREISRRDRLFGVLLGPLLILILGLVIGSMVVSLYLPIFTLGDAISMG